MSKSSNLPYGWIETDLGDLFSMSSNDIVDGPFGSNLKASEYVSSGVPIARLQNIDRNRFVAKNIQYVTLGKAEELARHTFVPGDILITKLGDPLGKACLAPESIEKGVLVADVVRARLTHEWVNRHFLCYQINADYIAEQFKDQTKGTTRPRVNLTKIRSLTARLCPLKEQTRIVAKLEELLSDLDAGVAELKAAQKKLAQYRQSLLKAAVEGALTAQWREEQRTNNTPAETGTQLLQRILTERRARWEAKQLAKFAEQGKTPPKDWQKKYPEPVQPDTSDLPELPEGWVWASVDQVGEVFLGKMLDKTKHVSGSKLQYLRNINVRWGEIDFSDLLEMFFENDELDRYGLTTGDVLVCEGGEPGRAAVFRGEFPEMKYQKALHRVRFFDLYEPELLVIFLEYSAKNGQLEKSFTGSTIKHFTKESFLQLAIPLPSMGEQVEIVREIGRCFETINEQEQAITLSLKQSTAQRQNILRAAFAGELVPQDPNDEPASVLLERIRAERAAQAAVKKPRGRKSRTQN